MALSSLQSTGRLTGQRGAVERLKYPVFGAAPKFEKPALETALCLDVDDTWVGWGEKGADGLPKGLMETNRYIRRQQPNWFTMINTGRGIASLRLALSELQQNSPKLFQGLRWDALSINNGQSLFLNTQKLPLVAWLSRLTLADQDAGWQAVQRAETQWDAAQALTKVQQLLSRAGVVWQPGVADASGKTIGTMVLKTGVLKTPSSDAFEVQVACYPDQPGYRLSLMPDVQRPDGASVERGLNRELAMLRWGKTLSAQWLSEQKTNGWQVMLRERMFSDPKSGVRQWVFVFSPEGIHKAKALSYVLTQKAPQTIRSVITAGDDPYNDTELLKSQYVNAAGQPVRNLAIAVGGAKSHHNGLMEATWENPDLYRVPENGLLAGLKHHWQTLLGQKQAKPKWAGG